MEHGPTDNAVSERASTAATNQLIDAIEQLRLAHAILSRDQFIAAIGSGELEVWSLPHGAHALVTWGTTEHGETCHILTVCGDANAAGEPGLQAIERMVRQRGGRMIITVARPAWRRLFEQYGYSVQPKILVKKVLES